MFVQFELPVAHLGEAGHYVPPMAREADEITRRQLARPGLLIAEQQELGTHIAAAAVDLLPDAEATDVRFTADILAVSGINTAWHLYAERQGMQVMRRNIQLPFMVGPRPDMRPTSADVLRGATVGIHAAAHEAHAVTVATRYGSPRVHDFRRRMGRTLGESSLLLATVDLGDKLAGSPRIRDSYVQRIVRARGTKTLEAARQKYKEVGSHPTMAGLADPLSDLRVFIARNAPTGALEIFNEAIATAHQ